MNILLIGNPISSGGHAGKRIRKLSLHLEQRGHRVTTYLTRFAGDGKNMIASLCQGMDRVVVIGGDGTMNEIISGLAEKSACPILHFPTGNANLLAQDLNLPQRLSRVVALVEQGKTCLADSGTMNTQRFLMVCGMGFDARVTEEVKKIRMGKVSNLSYVLPFLRAMKTSVSASLSVSVDNGAFEASGQAVVVCNVRNYGGICEIAFDAGIDTGCLDVVVLPREDLVFLLTCLAFAKFSRVTRLEGVVYLKAYKNVIIKSNKPIPVQLDGDFHDRHHEVRIDVHPASIPLIVP